MMQDDYDDGTRPVLVEELELLVDRFNERNFGEGLVAEMCPPPRFIHLPAGAYEVVVWLDDLVVARLESLGEFEEYFYEIDRADLVQEGDVA